MRYLLVPLPEGDDTPDTGLFIGRSDGRFTLFQVVEGIQIVHINGSIVTVTESDGESLRPPSMSEAESIVNECHEKIRLQRMHLYLKDLGGTRLVIPPGRS